MERTDGTDLGESDATAPAGHPDGAAPILEPPPVSPVPEKPVIRRLFDRLEDAGVAYCHWKSNIRLDRTLAGLEDIDLLVRPRDAALFQSVLNACGFRPTISRSGSGHPGVFHAVALCGSTADLVDLHAHFQVVSGDSLVKSFRFPVEEALLTTFCYQDGVRVPTPSAELVLFVLRIVLKHTSPVEILKTNRHYAEVSDELAWLRARSDSAQAEALCTSWFPSVGPALFRQALEAVATDAALPRRIMLGWRVAWRLRTLRRLDPLRAMLSRYRRVMIFIAGRLRKRRDLSLQTGGAIIALVGPKGCGKSTIGGQLARRLGRYLSVRRIHVGKPPPSVYSLLPRLFAPLLRRLLPGERLAEYQRPERRQERRYSLLHVVRMLLLAYDRRRLLFKALRAATSGTIVLCDRYPSDTPGAIDSSCFDDAALAKCRFPLKRWLMKKERSLYEGLPRPTLVLQLVAPLDLAIKRDAQRDKPGGPDPDAVRRRWSLENGAAFTTSPVIRIDTSRPLDDTVRSTVEAVWRAL